MIECSGESALIIGYGREGKSTHRYLQQHVPDLRISIADRNPIDPKTFAAKPQRVFSGEDYLRNINDFDTVFSLTGNSS